jgi:putative OPT family oligopeptide transporter
METPPPGQAPYRELTIASVVFGVLVGCLMTAAFVYIALKLGFGLGGSTVAAILGFAVLRGALRKGSIIENNINQTVASGVNNASAGIAFTFPALFLLREAGVIEDFSYIPVLLAALGGSFLGIAFIIPLRKQMIEFERLTFPSGIAVASLLRSPGAGARQAKLLAIGFGVAATFHALSSAGLFPEELDIGHAFGLPMYIQIGFAVSFASLGAGMLSGKGGLPFVLGGVLAWWVIAPIAVATGAVPGPQDFGLAAAPEGYDIWATWDVLYFQMLRPLGIGILIGGALSGVIASFPALKAAIGSLAKSSKMSGASSPSELPLSALGGGIVGSLLVLFLAAKLSSDLSVVRCFVTAVVGTAWLGLAGLIVAQATGMTDISPISGMSLIGVTIMFFLTGGNAIPAITLGVAVSIGIGQCADMMSDLKAGHLIGATPRKQQLAQFAVAWIGVPVAISVVYLIWNGIGFGPGHDLSAPQAAALAEIVTALGDGAVPLDKYAGGAALGLALGIFPISGLGVLVGLAMYLPFFITVTYGIGAVIGIVAKKVKGKAWIGSTLVPVAAGCIIGEALTSLVAVLIKLAIG